MDPIKTEKLKMDDQGRVHLPQPLRWLIGLKPGGEVEAQCYPDRIELRAVDKQ